MHTCAQAHAGAALLGDPQPLAVSRLCRGTVLPGVDLSGRFWKGPLGIRLGSDGTVALLPSKVSPILPLQVRIALQLDDGSRLQDTFCSGQTLWELLSHFAQTR